MGNYVSRDFARSRLRLGLRQSYRLLPSCYGALINTDAILELLNHSRRPFSDPVFDIPTDLMTAEELASITEFADSGITAHKLLTWARRRTAKIPPHFYFNRHAIRFSKSRFLAWLKERTHSSRCRKRIA